MINILVEITVKDFILLEKFESQAIQIMTKYDGRLLSAFETEREGNSGIEIHVLSFPSKELFKLYLTDKDLKALRDLRKHAISDTKVTYSTRINEY